MSINRTIKFLPEYLRTIPNQRFISSTLDRLTSSAQIKRFDGFIGRQYVDGAQLTGAYYQEDSDLRQKYQLESNFVLRDQNSNVTAAISFKDLLNSVAGKKGIVDNWNKLLTTNSQSWKGFNDLDKIVNYSKYVWVPKNSASGDWFWNNPVEVSNNAVQLNQSFAVSRTPMALAVSNINGPNPSVNMLRGGSYEFQVNADTTSTNSRPAHEILQSNSVSNVQVDNTKLFLDNTTAKFSDNAWLTVLANNDNDFDFSDKLWSIETFVNFSSLESNQIIAASWKNSDIDNSSWKLELTSTLNQKSIAFSWINPIDNSMNSLLYPGSLDQDQWHHIAVCRSANTVRLYINGFLANSVGYNNKFKQHTFDLSIGADSAGFSCLTANLSNLRISKNTARYVDNSYVVPTQLNNDVNTVLFLTFADENNSATFVDNNLAGSSKLWIQTLPNVNDSTVVNSRKVQGVTNNGISEGIISFVVPTIESNQIYLNLQSTNDSNDFVDLATDLNFNQIHNADYNNFIQIPNIGENTDITGRHAGIDSEINLDNKTLIFVNKQTQGWGNTARSKQFGIWKINVVNNKIKLSYLTDWTFNFKKTVTGGSVFQNTSWYKDSSNTLNLVPNLASLNSTLYLVDDFNSARLLNINVLSAQNLPNYPVLQAVRAVSNNNQILSGLSVLDGVNIAEGDRILLVGQTNAFENGIYIASNQNWLRSADLNQSFQLQTNFIVQILKGFVYANTYFSYIGSSNSILDQTPLVISQVNSQAVLDVSESIIGQAYYTSANGVEFINGLNVKFTNSTVPSPYNNVATSWIVEGVGKSIRLISVDDIRVSKAIQLQNNPPDYITINRASVDNNFWSISNQWFHINVLNSTVNYLLAQNVDFVLPNSFIKAVRPIIEFYPGLQLFDFATIALAPVDLVDFYTVDAFDNVQGKSAYSVDGISLTENSRIIFNADQNANVRNTIYTVKFIKNNNQDLVISLVPTQTASLGAGVLVLNGNKNSDKYLVWNTTSMMWIVSSQTKTSLNQAPLFDLFDINANSLANSTSYPSTTFNGSKLFGYATGAGPIDSVLGFALKYNTIGNQSDITFSNFYATDSFFYQPHTTSSIVKNDVASSCAQRLDFNNGTELYTPWEFVESNLELYQTLTFTGQSTIVVQGELLTKTNKLSSPHKIYVDGQQLALSDYTVTQTLVGSVKNIIITITSGLVSLDSLVLVKLLSSTAIKDAWYDVPPSFEQNPFGKDITEFTVTTLQRHFSTAISNLTDSFNSSLTTYNLDNNCFSGVAGSILYHESLSVLAALMLTQSNFDIDQSLKIAANDYVLYKQKFLTVATQIENIENLPLKDAVDLIINKLSMHTDSSMPWYTSDMVPVGGTKNNIKIINKDQLIIPIKNVYDWTQPNTKAILVYKNNIQLIRNIDYITVSNKPLLQLLTPALIGDVLSVYEINNTCGSMMPASPAKLGLAPLFMPSIYVDDTFVESKTVIQGHDGSITIAYNDYRDSLLLELEQRIFNNIKVDNQLWSNIIESRVPTQGVFRNLQRQTNLEVQPYSASDQNSILQRMFFEWIAAYKINYSQTYYNSLDGFTWNWSASSDKFGNILNGYWKGIYNNFYDTIYPHTKPWELLNISIKPTWWDNQYGPAPYTGQNLLMWDDIANGIIRNPQQIGQTALRKFNGISVADMIPVSDSGQLLDPNSSVVSQFNNNLLTKEFVFGDCAPVEAAWRSSSYYPFAKLRAQILQNPLFMCGNLWDLNNYKPTTGAKNFKFNNAGLTKLSDLKINSVDLDTNNQAVCVNSLVNYSIEYLRKQGKDVNEFRTALDNVDVNLVYDLAGFADTNNISIYADQNSSDDQGNSIKVPQEDYDLFLSQNLPTGVITYSGVIITITDLGYKVSGYDQFDPFFNILPSLTQSESTDLTIGNSSFKIYKNYSTTVESVPYNTLYADRQSLIDFLISYGRYLESLGLIFETQNTQEKISWYDATVQFVKWSYENWSFDNNNQSLALVLNPSASQLKLKISSGTLQDLTNTEKNILVDVNRNQVDQKYLDVFRDDNFVTITHQAGNVLAGLRANIVTYEHRLIIKNTTIFNDIINDPLTGIRQNRLRIVGQKTGDWNGTLNTPGFMIVTGQVDAWSANQDYLLGSLVKFKNSNYVALNDIIGASTFQYTEFSLIDTNFKNAVLPNLSLKGDDLINASDIDYRNYISDFVRLRANTLGYIEKSWLSDLGLDLAAQTNFYKGWIKEKGTSAAITNFGRASNDLFSTAVTINEEFAVKIGDYGATNRTGYGEVLLQSTHNNQNPIAVKFTNTPDVNDSYTLQVPTFSLYKKSNNWTENLIQTQGNIKNKDLGFTLAGPVLPSTLINIAEQRIPNFNSNTDAKFLNFDSLADMVSSLDQQALIRIVKNAGLFWIKNDLTRIETNKWNVIKFIAANTKVVSITRLNSNSLSLELNSDIQASIGSVIAVDYIDPISNIDICGLFTVKDYTLAPSLTSISTLVLERPGEYFNNNNTITPSTDTVGLTVYQTIDLRFNNLAEINGNLDEYVFVENNEYDWASYQLLEPYSHAVTPVTAVGSALTTQVVYDFNDKLLWLARPYDYAGKGSLLVKSVQNYTTPSGDVQPLLNVDLDNVVVARNDSVQLGYQLLNLGNSRVGASALNDQVYIAALSPNELLGFTQVEQILSVRKDQLTSLANASANFGQNLAASADGQWLFVGSPNVSYTNNVQIFEKHSTTACKYTTKRINSKKYLLTGAVVPTSAYSLRVILTDVPSSVLNQLLIPELEFTVNGNNLIFFTSVPSTANIVVEQIDLFYQFVDSVSNNSVGFATSLSTNSDGSKLVVGAPATNSGSVLVYSRLDNKKFTLDQTITNSKHQFGSSVALNQNSLLISSIGQQGNSLTEHTVNNQGCVDLYVGNNSMFEFVQQLTNNKQNSLMFGEQIKWLTDQMFAVKSNYLTGSVTGDQLVINDGTQFDKLPFEFSNSLVGFAQYVSIYQLLEYNNQFQAVKVKDIEASSSQGAQVFFDGNLQNLWVGNAVDSKNNLFLYNNKELYQGWTVLTSKSLPLEPRSIAAAWIYDQLTNTKLVDLAVVDLSTGLLPTNITKQFNYLLDLDPASYEYQQWAAYNSYNKNEFVIFDNNLYQAISDISGSAIFNKSAWALVSLLSSFSNSSRSKWNSQQVGQKWFNTNGLKVIDSQIGTIGDAQQYCNSFFPGSTVKVYEWIASSVAPSKFISSDVNGFLDSASQPFVFDKGVYYFWVYNKSTVSNSSQTSSASLAATLQNINNSGIALISPLAKNAVAVWNVNQYLNSNNAVLHIDYITAQSNNKLHSEFALLSNNGKKTWLTTPLYEKFIDSLTGVTANNLLIPDETLSDSQKYGTTSGLQQSIFVDRQQALLIYYNTINAALLKQPVASAQLDSYLTGASTLPTSGFNQSVPTKETLMSLDTSNLPENYRVLVVNNSDIRNNGWSIVALTSQQQWLNIQNQTFDLSSMFEHRDWIAENYKVDLPTFTINNIGEIASISMVVNDTVGILNNGNSNYAVYQLDLNNNLNPVYIQNGTIQFLPQLYDFSTSQIGFDNQPFDQIRYFDDDPYETIRIVTKLLNETILVGNLSQIADDAFFAILRYIIHENKNLDWIFNTSFVNVDYPAKNLNVQGNYRADNQDLVEKFMAETLPFHTRIREFKNTYTSIDSAALHISDFDLPAQYDSAYANDILLQTNSPIVNLVRSPNGSLDSDVQSLTQPIYADWNNNFSYSLSNILVVDGGSNYTSTPTVIVTGGGGSGWTGQAIVDPVTGQLVAVNTITPGHGYTSTPAVQVLNTGNNTVPAKVYAILTNNKTRKINTSVRFDRIGYTTESFTGNVETSTALNRINAYYKPTSDMLGNRPQLLMTGLNKDHSVIGNETFVASYSVPSGPLSYQDDPLVANTSLMLTFDSALVYNNAFNQNIFKFGSQSGNFNRQFKQSIIVDLDASVDIDQLNLAGNDFTLEFFTRFSSFTDDVFDNDEQLLLSQPVNMILVDTRTSVDSVVVQNSGIVIYKDVNNNLSLTIYDPAGNQIYMPTVSGGGLGLNIWQFIVLERKANRFSLYLDGNKVVDYSTINSVTFNNKNLTFGADVLGANNMSGYIDEFRLTVNTNRYDITQNTLIVPSQAFARDKNQDDLLDKNFTKVLFGFSSFVNESATMLMFKAVNNSTVINDISTNKKVLNLTNYNQQLLIDKTTFIGNLAAGIYAGQFNRTLTNVDSVGYITASADADYNFAENDFAIELWANADSSIITPATLLELVDAQSISSVDNYKNRLIIRLINNNQLNVVALQVRNNVVVKDINNIVCPLPLVNMEVYYNGRLLNDSDYSIVDSKFVFEFTVAVNDLIEIAEVITSINAGQINQNFDYFISVERKDGIAYVFVNGNLVATASLNLSFPSDNQFGINSNNQLELPPATVFIGANRSGRDPFVGLLGDIRITKNTTRYVGTALASDTTSSFYTDSLNNALTANINGGNFINNIPVNAPEEHVALGVFDNLDLQVYEAATDNVNSSVSGFRIVKSLLGQDPFVFTSNVISETNQIAVKWNNLTPDAVCVQINGNAIASDMFTIDNHLLTLTNNVVAGDTITVTNTGQTSLFDINASSILQLAANLNANDTKIFLSNVSSIQTPNPSAGIFGKLAINGEQITFLTIDRSAKSVSGLRRGVNRTGIGNLYTVHSQVLNSVDDLQLPYSDRINVWTSDSLNPAFIAAYNSLNVVYGTNSSNILANVNVLTNQLFPTIKN